MSFSLDDIERAVRNICRGKNAFSHHIGCVQARIVKTLQEEGVAPLQLLEKGLVRPIKRKETDEEVKPENFSHE